MECAHRSLLDICLVIWTLLWVCSCRQHFLSVVCGFVRSNSLLLCVGDYAFLSFYLWKQVVPVAQDGACKCGLDGRWRISRDTRTGRATVPRFLFLQGKRWRSRYRVSSLLCCIAVMKGNRKRLCLAQNAPWPPLICYRTLLAFSNFLLLSFE